MNLQQRFKTFIGSGGDVMAWLTENGRKLELSSTHSVWDPGGWHHSQRIGSFNDFFLSGTPSNDGIRRRKR